MKISNIITHLSMRHLLYEIITNMGKYFIKMNFDEKDISIFKYEYGIDEYISPIKFLNILKSSHLSSNDKSDKELLDFFIELLTSAYLQEERNNIIEKLM